MFEFDIKAVEKYHLKATSSPYKHYRIPNPETLLELGKKGLVAVTEEPLFILVIYPHPPFGWLHFATENLSHFKGIFWEAVNVIRKNLIANNINTLRVGLRESTESNYLELFRSLGFSFNRKILIMEKYDFNIPDYGNAEVKMRQGTDGDIDSLVEIERLCFNEEFRFTVEDFKVLINRPMFYVATLENKVVGYLYLRIIEENVGHYVRVAVHPNYQRKGIGTRLTAFAVEKFKENNVSKIFLRTLEELVPAIKLYEKFGFKHVDNEVILEKILH